jgi:HNH endonuclease
LGVFKKMLVVNMKICLSCNKKFFPKSKKNKNIFCSHNCYWKSSRGKKRVPIRFSHGYKYLFVPNHPNANDGRYVAEHRLVMEKELGRYLLRHEIVHHKNANKMDNRLENLELHTRSSHGLQHSLENVNNLPSKEFLKTLSRKRRRDGFGRFL